MKIITGTLKGRVIPTIKNGEYRPSTTRFREALFSILSSGEFAESQPIKGANILDVFAGTGVLSFEAISRGAAKATLVDLNSKFLEHANNFAERIGIEDQVETLCSNALFLPRSNQAYDVVFLDPPYYKQLAKKTMKCMVRREWLANGALVAVELEKTEDIEDFDNFSLIKQRVFGKSKLLLFKYNQNVG